MSTLLFTEENDNILIGSDANFLGLGGDDTYIFGLDLIPDNAEVTISDNEGSNTLRLPTGLDIASSDVATLSDGGVALQLTLTNGTTIFVDRADEFDFQVGGDIFGNGSTDQSVTEFVENTLGTTMPAPGEISRGEAVIIFDGFVGPDAVDDSFGPILEDAAAQDFDVLANDSNLPPNITPVIDSVDTTGTEGTVTFDADSVTYDPAGAFDDLETGEQATDTFSYTITDGAGNFDTATVTVTIDGVTPPPILTTNITEAATFAATPNEEELFVLRVDNSGGDITNPDYDGTATISGFDPAEDTLVFENVAGSDVTEADILAENGLNVLANPFATSVTYILADDPGVPGTDGALLSVEGISGQNSDFIEVA